MPNHFHWRQIFDIVRGEVVLLNQVSQLDQERKIPLRDVVTRLEDNRIILGKKRHQLNLVLLQPKQRARPGDLDATVGIRLILLLYTSLPQKAQAFGFRGILVNF